MVTCECWDRETSGSPKSENIRGNINIYGLRFCKKHLPALLKKLVTIIIIEFDPFSFLSNSNNLRIRERERGGRERDRWIDI